MIEAIPVALDIKLHLRVEILPYYIYVYTHCTNFIDSQPILWCQINAR